jgi:ribosomal protein L3
MKRLLYLMVLTLGGLKIQAQSNCATGDCNDNAFLNSKLYNDPNTLAYDNLVSVFHSSMGKEADGTIKVWGQGIAPAGTSTSHFLSPTPVTAAMGLRIPVKYCI